MVLAERSLTNSRLLLMMATQFVAALSFGVVLPVLPFILQRSGYSATAISQHTGMLTGVYMFAVALTAPLWGRYSDRAGRYGVLLMGLAGLTTTLVLFAVARELVFAYIARALSGVFVAAVTTAATAQIGDLSSPESRAGHFAKLTSASLLGFLAGPSLSSWFSTTLPGSAGLYMSVVVVAALSALATVAVAIAIPRRGHMSARGISRSDVSLVRAEPALLVIAVMYALVSFEVGITLVGQQRFGWSASQIGTLFAECSAVMLLIQGALFSLLVARVPRIRLMTAGLAMMLVGLALLAGATSYGSVFTLVMPVAAGASIVTPTIAYWASMRAGPAQGSALGLQTAASSLGQALGSAATGILFAGWFAAPFWVAAAVILAAGTLIVAQRQLGALLKSRTPKE